MPLNFTPSSEQAPDQDIKINETITEEASTEQNLNIQTVKETSLMVPEEIKQDLPQIDPKAVNELVSTININDSNSLVKFGAEAAEEISKVSDQVLNSMSMDKINDSGELLKELEEVMSQFDIKEISADDEKGLKKLFSNARRTLEKILSKYETMGKHIDRIYVSLKGYEDEIQVANTNLNKMYDSNIEYYRQLMVYIAAGEQACKELDTYIEDYRAKAAANPSGTVAMDLQTLENSRQALEQRVMDLKIAENVAMQTIPMLKTMEFSNVNLVRKINSAFIITMPVFKQALAQAIMLKRQRIQAEAMSTLDEKTNELLIKNAENTVNQSKLTAQLASGSSIKVETLEKTWQTIVTGIEETKQIQEQASAKRIEDTKRLEALKEQYKNSVS